MSKREASQIAAAAGVDIDAPRAKRRKDAAPDSKQSTGASGADAIKKEGEGGEPSKRDPPEVVQEKGLKLWTVVKDAVDKECVTIRLLASQLNHSDSERVYLLLPPVLVSVHSLSTSHHAYASNHPPSSGGDRFLSTSCACLPNGSTLTTMCRSRNQ